MPPYRSERRFPRVAQLRRGRPSVTRGRVEPRCMVSLRGGGRKRRTQSTVLVYRRGMPGRKRPTPEDAVTARHALLDGLARDADIVEVLSGLAPLHPRNDTFPGEVFLDLAADALEWCGASRAEPLPLEGLRERFLPEASFRGRQNAKLQYAVLAAAAVHGGTGPDRTCSMRAPRGRPTTSGSTPCTRRSPTSVPPPAGRASRCARHARTWTSALAILRYNDALSGCS